MKISDALKRYCPMAQGRCRGEGCMAWIETGQNMGSCIYFHPMVMPQKLEPPIQKIADTSQGPSDRPEGVPL